MPGEYRLVIKGHDGNQIGVLTAYESLTFQKFVSNVGSGVLIANYGVTDATDTLLNAITTDRYLEVQRRIPGVRDWYVEWLGVAQDEENVTPDIGTLRDTWRFDHVNHTLRRRIVLPQSDAIVSNIGRVFGSSRWASSGLLANAMRELVRVQVAYPEDESRRTPGMYVEGDDAVPAGAGLPGLVFGRDYPTFYAAMCSEIWSGELFVGMHQSANTDLLRTIDGETWTTITTPASRLAASLHVFHDGVDERLYMGVGYAASTFVEGGEVYRSDPGDPTTWNLVLNPARSAIVPALEEHAGDLYAATAGNVYLSGGLYGTRANIYRTTVDGATWELVFDGNIGGGGTIWEKYQHFEVLYSWGGYIYAGGNYVDAAGHSRARIIRSQTGALGTWAVVFDEVATDEDGNQTDIFGVSSLLEFGGEMYAGTGSRINPRGDLGRIFKTADGTTYTQVFGANMDETPHQAAPAVTAMAGYDGALWIGTGGDQKGSGQVWYTEDGEEYFQSFDGRGHEYLTCHSLVAFGPDLYACMGAPVWFGPSQYFTGYRRDSGDIWRQVSGSWGGANEFQEITSRMPYVLDVLKQMAEFDAQVDFMVEPSNIPGDVQAFLFRAAAPLGTDRRSTSANPTIFGVPRGNMASPRYAVLRKDRKTVLYVLGSGSGEQRQVSQYKNVAELAISPLSRIEGVIDFRGADSPVQRRLEALHALNSVGPQREFSFTPLETPATRYGQEWEVGDWITGIQEQVDEDDIVAHCLVQGVTITLRAGGNFESIQAAFKVLEFV